jgi:hypothetical protein
MAHLTLIQREYRKCKAPACLRKAPCSVFYSLYVVQTAVSQLRRLTLAHLIVSTFIIMHIFFVLLRSLF